MQRVIAMLLFVAAISLSPFASAENDTRRDDAIEKLTRLQVERSSIVLDDNILDSVLFRFRKANPEATEATWREIKAEVKNLFINLLAAKGGIFSLIVKEVAPQFSTEELEKLVATYSDPLFIKFNDASLFAMKKQNVEFAMRIAIESSVAEINNMLIKRGLKPVY